MGERDDRDDVLNVWLGGLARDLPDGQVAGYVALGGKKGERARGFAIVEIPEGIGPAAIGRHMESPRPSASERIALALDAHAAYAWDLELALAEKTAYVDELLAEREEFLQRREGEALGVRALEARIAELEAQNREWRSRAAIAEGEALRARLEVAVLRGEAPPDLTSEERIAALEAELEEAREKLERATRNWRDAEAKSDAAWRRVGEIQTELDEQRERAVTRSAEQRRTSQMAMTKAMEDASLKLVGVRDQLLRCEKRCDELKAELEAAERARAELTARLEHTGGAASPGSREDE